MIQYLFHKSTDQKYGSFFDYVGLSYTIQTIHCNVQYIYIPQKSSSLTQQGTLQCSQWSYILSPYHLWGLRATVARGAVACSRAQQQEMASGTYLESHSICFPSDLGFKPATLCSSRCTVLTHKIQLDCKGWVRC